jgi:hypothetical protein
MILVIQNDRGDDGELFELEEDVVHARGW